MRRILNIVVLLCLVVSCWALPVETPNARKWPAVEIHDGVETILLFRDEIALHLVNGPTTVYDLTGKKVSEGQEVFFPDDGTYYVETGGMKDYFTVLSYKTYILEHAFDFKVYVQPRCRETIITMTPAMTYITSAGVAKTLNRQVTVSYTDIGWGESNWQDSAAVYSGTMMNNRLHIPAFYRATDFVVQYDSLWRDELNLPQDSIVSELIQPIAVKSHPTATVTVRGKENERSNEVDRPTDAKVLESRSAPLEVFLEAHPSPAVQFYSWRFTRGNEELATRQDETVRYTFMNPGGYTITHSVANMQCPCNTNDGDCDKDSTQFKVSIQESQLLVPNVFTPNGDGQNDEFRILYRSLRDYHIWVYNRWGKLVYESTDPSRGWDGTINGRPAAEGAYYYVIRAIGTDAAKDASFHSRQAYEKGKLNSDDAYLGVYQLSGDINLLRGKQK